MKSKSPSALRNAQRIVPSLLTALRFSLLPVIWLLWIRGHGALAISFYALAVLTDWADGRLARRLGVASTAGALFDAVTDIAFLVVLLLLQGVAGHVPFWLFVAPLAAGTTFLLTSGRIVLRYDPVGKNFGGILFVIVGCLLIVTSPRLCNALCLLIVVLSAIVLTNRLVFSRKMAAR